MFAFSKARQNLRAGSAIFLLCSVGMSSVCHCLAVPSSFTHKFKAGLPPLIKMGPEGRARARGRADSIDDGAERSDQLQPTLTIIFSGRVVWPTSSMPSQQTNALLTHLWPMSVDVAKTKSAWL